MKLTWIRLLRHHAAGVILFSIIPVLFFLMPLSAQHKKGAYVRVFLNDGTSVSGELLAVKMASIVVFNKGTDQGTEIDAHHIEAVKVSRPGRIGFGVLIGAVVGYLLADLGYHEKGASEFSGLGYLLYPPAIANLGGLLGIGFKWKYIYKNEFPLEKGQAEKEILEKLKPFARETAADLNQVLPGSKGPFRSIRSPFGRRFLQRLHLDWNPAFFIWSYQQGSVEAGGSYRFLDEPDGTRILVKSGYGLNDRFADFFHPRRLGLSYKAASWLTAGLEYTHFGKYENGDFFALTFEGDTNEDVFTHLYLLNYKYSLQTLMIGMELNTGSFANRSVRLSVGGMAGVSLVELEDFVGSTLKIEQKYPQVKPGISLKARLACDFYLGRLISGGVYIEYLSAMASFPEVRGEGAFEFESRKSEKPPVARPVELVLPAHQHGFRGLCFGLSFRLTPFARRR